MGTINYVDFNIFVLNVVHESKALSVLTVIYSVVTTSDLKQVTNNF